MVSAYKWTLSLLKNAKISLTFHIMYKNPVQFSKPYEQ